MVFSVIGSIATAIIGVQTTWVAVTLMFVSIYAGMKLTAPLAKLTIVTAAIALGWNQTALSGSNYDAFDLAINAGMAYGVMEVA